MTKGSSGSAETYDYYGTLASVVCRGPVDALQAIIVDGRTILSGPIGISAAATTWTSLDPGQEKWLGQGGRITLYRGTQTSPDAALPGHPDYRGTCYLVFVKLLFGRERTSAPNIQVVVSRKPVADLSLVPAEHNVFTALDGSGLPTLESQVNPVAVAVELLTGGHGLRIPVADLDAATWSAAAAWAADPARILHTFCSPLITAQSSAADVLTGILTMLDAGLYWTASGKLAIALLEPGVDPGATPTFDARHWTTRPRLVAAGWEDVPTSVAVRYPERAAQWKQRQVKIDQLAALRHRAGVPQASVVDRPHVTNANQASLHAIELARRAAQPIADIEIRVRRPLAANLHPGSKIRVDVDPVPGGAGLAQVCVVQEVRSGSTGPVQLRCRPDTLVASVPYTPAWTVAVPQAPDCPPIDASRAVVVPLRPGISEPAAIAVLAPRPRADVVGVRLFFGTSSVGDFADLGSHPGFAVRVALGASVASTDSAAILSLPEGTDGPDAYLAARYPGTQIGAEDDVLLLVLANLDVNGRIVVGADELPELEICSIVTRAAVGADVVYDLLRARQGTAARAWTTAAKGWVIPRTSFRSWTHPELSILLYSGQVGYVRMVAYSAQAEDDTVPIPEISFLFPPGYDLVPKITWTTPAGSGAVISGETYVVAFDVTDRDGDLVHVTLHSEKDGDIDILAEFPLLPTASTSYSGTHKFASGTHRLTVTARDRAGRHATSSRILTRTSGGGGDPLPPPDFSPASPILWGSHATSVTISAPSGSGLDRLEWKATSPSITAPGSGTMEVVTSKSVTVVVMRNFFDGWTGLPGIGTRLWARSGNGTNWSAWVFVDIPWRRL